MKTFVRWRAASNTKFYSPISSFSFNRRTSVSLSIFCVFEVPFWRDDSENMWISKGEIWFCYSLIVYDIYWDPHVLKFEYTRIGPPYNELCVSYYRRIHVQIRGQMSQYESPSEVSMCSATSHYFNTECAMNVQLLIFRCRTLRTGINFFDANFVSCRVLETTAEMGDATLDTENFLRLVVWWINQIS